MTRARTLLVVGAGLLAMGAAACNNDKLTELNKNPNSPEDVPASTLFTFAAQTAASRWLGGGYSLRATEFVVNHLAEVQYPDEDSYTRLDPGSTQGYFNTPYVRELEDFYKVVKKGRDANEVGTWAPAEIMQAWVFSFITNTWGDVPYSEALKADSIGGTLNPVYDTQQAIYTDLFARLTAASTALTGAANTLGSADPVFGGNPASWQKFANSLRARLALLIINKDATTANTQLTAALSAPGGIITSNAGNAQLNWPGDGLYNNPWSDNFKGRDDHRISRRMIEQFINTSDPRVAVYAMPATRDTVQTTSITKYCTGAPPCYVGLQNGMTQATAGPYVPYTSRPGAVFYPGVTAYGTFGGSGASFPSFLFTAAEGNFILAEASERSLGGRTPLTAAAAYNAGIQASMDQWGVAPAAATAFLANPNVVYAGGVAGLVQIATQKWVALYTDGGTAWAEWRRTCQPASVVPGPNAILSTIPRRFGYSVTEYQVNRVNVDEAVTRQGPDEFTTHMWWDNPSVAPTYALRGPGCA